MKQLEKFTIEASRSVKNSPGSLKHARNLENRRENIAESGKTSAAWEKREKNAQRFSI